MTDHSTLRPIMSADFREALIALLPRLRRSARVRTGNPDEADDLVQATCERAWRSRDQWQPGTQFENWVFTIMHNLRLDQLRAASARGIDAGDEPLEQIAGESFQRRVEAQDLLAKVGAVLMGMPEAMREVLSLVTVEGLSYQQAAEVLGVPVGTVMSRLARARIELVKRTGVARGDLSGEGAHA